MKTTKYIFNLKTLLVFTVSVFFISCSDDDGDKPRFTSTPGQAVLIAPLNNQECEIGEVIGDRAVVSLSWEAASETEKYDIVVENLITHNTILTIGLPENYTTVTLLRGYPYAWTVTSRNSGEAETDSETWKFYLSGEGESNSVPFPATLLSPSSGVTVTPTDGKVTLDWESSDADGDSVTYTVYADTVDGNQNVPDEWKDITESTIDIAVQPGTIYFWHIETSDGINTSISQTYTFKTSE